MSSWNYASARPPGAAIDYREQQTINLLNVDNMNVYSTARIKNLVVTGAAEFLSIVAMRSTLSVQGATTLSTLTVTSWSHLSGPVICQSTLSVLGAASMGSLYVAGTTTLVNEVQMLSNVSIDGSLSISGDTNVFGEVVTLSQFRNSVGVIDPQIGDLKSSILSNGGNGWVLCDGRELNRNVYSTLWNAIGITFGVGDGVNTFNIPNVTGRVLGNVGNGHILGQTMGSDTISLTNANVPSHTHSGTTGSDGTHNHTMNDPGHSHTQTTVNDDFNNSGGSGPSFAADSAGSITWTNINSNTTGITINNGGAHTHTFTTDGGSGLIGSAFNVMQPTIFIGYTLMYTGIAN